MVSHSPKPLTFYDNTKLLNIHTVLNFTDFEKHFSMSNNSCSILKQKFFDELLETVRLFQKVARRLLSLPGFSTLIECDTYLSVNHQKCRVHERTGIQFRNVRLGRCVTVEVLS